MADEVDRANDLFEDRRTVEIRSIRRTLEQTRASIECEDCGEDIDPERRRALPSASRCIVCQNQFEINRRLYRH